MKKNGFTLVEIMLAVGLIAILLAVGVPAIRKSAQNSRIKKATSELEMLATAVLQLAWDTGKWPNGTLRTAAGSEEKWDLSTAICGLLENDGSYNTNNWKGPYIGREALEDPWWNETERHRVYFFDPDYRHKEEDGTIRDAIVVGSFGPNGVGRNQYDADDIYILLDD